MGVPGANPNWPGMKVLVDFTNPGTAQAAPAMGNGTFDANVTGWNSAPGPVVTLAQSTTTKHDGNGALQLTWQTAAASGALAAFSSGGINPTNLIPGAQYVLTCWVLVPNGSTASINVQVQGGNGGVVTSAAVPIDGAWHLVTLPFTVDSSGTFTVNFQAATGTATIGQFVYIDTVLIDTPWTDITSYVRRIGDGQLMQTERGRNYERAQTDAGTAILMLDNSTGAFDSTNTSSPFYPGVKPVRKVKIQASWTSANPNVMPNGTFDVSAAGWLANGWLTAQTSPPSISRQTGTVHDGAGALRVAWETAGANALTVYSDTISGLSPGVTYSVTAWVQSAVGQTGVLFSADDGAGGSLVSATVAATGAWVQGTLSFVAPASGKIRVGFQNTVATTLGWLSYVDTVVAVSTAPTAATTYNVFYGYIEDWPRLWDRSGFWGEVAATARGVFSSLSNVQLNALWVAAAITDGAQAIYRLNDPSGSVQAANWSSFQQNFALIEALNSLTTNQSKFTFGSNAGSGNLGGDPSPGLLLAPEPDGTINGGTGAFTPNNNGSKGFALLTAFQNGINQNLLLSPSGGWTVELWFQLQNVPPTGGAINPGYTLFYQGDGSTSGAGGTGSSNANLEIHIDTSGFLHFQIQGTSGNTSQAFNNNYADGNWHHVVATYDASNNFSTYVDGVINPFAPFNRVVGPWIHNPSTTLIAQQFGINASVGGGLYVGGALNGALKNIALYPAKALTAAQILNHFNAGGGYSLDDTGTRISRILNIAPYSAQALDGGNSFLGPADIENKNLVQALQDANDTEVGVLVERADGTVVFKNRHARGGTASVATFGESANPYEDGIQFLQDPKEIYTSVKVARNQGSTVINTDTAAAQDFFPRTLTINSQDWSDQQAIYLSAYQLARYKKPHDRIPNLTIIPSANPSLFPQALGREIGDRITVTRNNPGAPGITEDFYIDKITHQVSMPNEWKTIWMLSSATLYDAWVLGDATFGVLGSTTVLGF